MATRKLAMDEAFSDHMHDLGDVDSTRVTGRWTVVASHATTVSIENLPRLVQLAHEVAGDREDDRWFWGPFKDADPTFQVANASRLHATLAAFCLQARIRLDSRALDAHLVKLAALQGLVAPLGGLPDLASQSLLRQPTSPPKPAGVPKLWDDPGADQGVDSQVVALAAGTDAVVTTLAKRIEALGTWARDAELRFDREHRVIEWLLAGQRADGQQWEDVDAGSVVVDAAFELATIIGGPPQPHHENILGQVLKLAEVPSDGIGVDLTAAIAPIAEVANPSLAKLVPLSATRDPVSAPSFELSRRAMWERVALDQWSANT